MRFKKMKLLKPIRIVLASLMLAGNSWPGLLLSGTGRFAPPGFVCSLLLTGTIWARSSQARLAPVKIVDLSKFSLSDYPSDAELMKLACFEESLIPTSAPSLDGENHDLALAIKAEFNGSSDEIVSQLDQFTQKYPKSRWVTAVQVNRGLILYKSGYYSRAVDAFRQSWEAAQMGEGHAKGVADRALAEWMRMDCRVGRK